MRSAAASDEPRPKRKAAARINYKALHQTGEKVPFEEARVLCLLTLHGTEHVAEPRNLKEAQSMPEWPEWDAAMDRLMDDEFVHPQADADTASLSSGTEHDYGQHTVRIHQLPCAGRGFLPRLQAQHITTDAAETPALEENHDVYDEPIPEMKIRADAWLDLTVAHDIGSPADLIADIARLIV